MDEIFRSSGRSELWQLLSGEDAAVPGRESHWGLAITKFLSVDGWEPYRISIFEGRRLDFLEFLKVPKTNGMVTIYCDINDGLSTPIVLTQLSSSGYQAAGEESPRGF